MQIIIDKNSSDQRLDRFIRKYCKPYPEVKLADIFSRIRKGNIKVNDRKTKENYRLQINDIIKFHDKITLGSKNPKLLISQKEHKLQNIKPQDLKKRILYEDTNRLVRNKQSGIVIHPSNKHRNDLTMNDYLDAYFQTPYLVKGKNEKELSDTPKKDSTFKPSFGYRLDKDTSGVLISAKTYKSLQYLNQIIRDRNIEKYYMTIVIGPFPKHKIITKSLEKIYNRKFGRAQIEIRDNGIQAKTECRVQKTINHNTLGKISLVKVKIHTGRMHQIRTHLAHIGFPVLGDIIYWNSALNRLLYKKIKINRQLLHCRKYQFTDTDWTTKLSFEAPLPNDFTKLIP